MIKSLAVLLVSLAASSNIAMANTIIGIDDLGPAEEQRLRKLAPYYLQISRDLCASLEDKLEIRLDPERIVKFAKEELDKPGCLGPALNLNIFKGRARKDALDLFVSLEDSLDDCDSKSYTILARNYFMHQLIEYKFWSFMTKDVLMHYMIKHAAMCRPVHKDRYAERIKRVPEQVQAKLKRAFDSLNAQHFGTRPGFGWDYFNLVGMPKPVLTEFKSFLAVELIGQNLKASGIGQTKHSAKELRPMLDRELFEPCEVFRNQLASVLDLARIDAGASRAGDRASLERLYWSDDDFYQALVNNRLCAALLAEREKLYEPLTEAYNVAFFL